MRGYDYIISEINKELKWESNDNKYDIETDLDRVYNLSGGDLNGEKGIKTKRRTRIEDGTLEGEKASRREFS